MLELRHIGHSYGETRILEDISLTVQPGQRTAIMGPSGCGKTTLLRIALGLLAPTRGTAEIRFA